MLYAGIFYLGLNFYRFHCIFWIENIEKIWEIDTQMKLKWKQIKLKTKANCLTARQESLSNSIWKRTPHKHGFERSKWRENIYIDEQARRIDEFLSRTHWTHRVSAIEVEHSK